MLSPGALCASLVSRVRADWLLSGTLFYLFLPAFLFFAGWLHPGMALVLAAATAIGLYGCLGEAEAKPRPVRLGRRIGAAAGLLASLGICMVAVYYSGVAGYAPDIGVADPAKQHMSLYETMARPWPMAYEGEEVFGKPGPRVPAYHFFYYLVPGAVGKLSGWQVANHFLAVWVAIGVWLIVQWLGRLTKAPLPVLALLFLFFGGLDLFAQTLFGVEGRLQKGYFADLWWSQAGSDHPQMATQQLHYPGHYLLLSWFPNHALPAWLGAVVILHEVWRRKRVGNLYFIAAVLPMWSVFAAMGVLPFLLASSVAVAWPKWRAGKWLQGLAPFATVRNLIVGPVIVLVSALLLLSNDGGAEGRFLIGELAASWPMLLIFYGIEFGLLLFLLPKQTRCAPMERVWWWTAIACLVLIPFYTQGVVNDFCGRVYMPAYLVVFVFVVRYLFAPIENVALHRMVMAVLLAGMLPSLHVLWTNQNNAPSSLRPPALADVMPYHEYAANYPEHAVQGLGPPDAFFWKYLAKPLHVVREVIGPIAPQRWFAAGEASSQWFVDGKEFTGHLQITNEVASHVIAIKRSGTGLRSDLIRRIDVVGGIEMEIDGQRKRLDDVGTVKLSIRTPEGRFLVGPATMEGRGTPESPWSVQVAPGLLRRGSNTEVWLEVELLREGVHHLSLASIDLWSAKVDLVVGSM